MHYFRVIGPLGVEHGYLDAHGSMVPSLEEAHKVADRESAHEFHDLHHDVWRARGYALTIDDTDAG